VSQKEEQLQTDSGVQQKIFVSLLRSWSELTIDEQKAVITVLAIFILGLAVRTWHVQKEESTITASYTTVIHQSGKEIRKNGQTRSESQSYHTNNR
jgi:hypothetical protein